MLLYYLSMLITQEEQSKMAAIYIQYRRLILKVAYEKIHDFVLAEDCLHEAFIDIAKYLDRIHDIDSPEARAYVTTIARTHAYHIYNKEKRQREIVVEFGIDESTDVVDDDFFRAFDVEDVREAILNLPEDFRDIVILKCLNDLEYSEIAKIAGISEALARKRVERGKKLLKEALKGRECYVD